jgi:broad specificity phosphatase PhoE
MSIIYLIRHGQAHQGSDGTLTDLGRRQAMLLGAYFVERKVPFRAIYSGGLARQLETAENVREVYRTRRITIPGVIVEPGWDEVDIHRLYEELAPRLSEDDPEFKKAYSRLLQLKNGNEDLPRVTSICHTAIINAWIAGLYPFSGQAWSDFLRALTEQSDTLARYGRDDAIAVFTSITPIAISIGMTGVSQEQMFAIGRQLHHTGFTILDMSDRRIQLRSVNELAHLTQPEMRTLL